MKHVDIKIYQGDTWERVIRWETKPFIYIAISAITQAAPVVITADGHTLSTGWRVAVIDVLGMDEINSEGCGHRDSDFKPCTVIDSDNISFNEISSANFDPYQSPSGYLKFYTPVALTGFTARMDFMDRVGGTVLNSIGTTEGGIVIDPSTNTITLTLSQAITEAFEWTNAVYDLQMIDGSGNETTIMAGNVTVTDDVTEGTSS